MGNCASNPKTNEGDAPAPEPAVTEEVKVEQQENTKAEEETLGNLLNENGETEAVAEQGEAKNEEEKKPETEEVQVEANVEEKSETEEAKPEEEKPADN
ncbi:uncharacterized protein LOC130723601 [Lotus japonicus]|uniref:uncharacterized protein LOC130723601 n=1 Tax=Lotus japonicus TaxID=34305 RepID=UPI0025839C47|nr:uncharacterized protein LOC130723601 [Lotus japonicus]